MVKVPKNLPDNEALTLTHAHKQPRASLQQDPLGNPKSFEV
jgi:hypothetical protein